MRTYDQFYINGQWVDPIGKGRSEVINPATGEITAVVPYGNAEDVDAASFRGRLRPSPPRISAQGRDIVRDNAAAIPDLCLPGAYADTSSGP